MLKKLGARVISIGVKPNGFNINDKCGSTYPFKIQSAVKKHKAHVGISFDGDADRIIMCDEKGKIINGDQIIAMLAKRWKMKKNPKRRRNWYFNVKLWIGKFFKKRKN